MKYWRTPSVDGQYTYARTYPTGYRADRKYPGDDWVRDDYLWSEIRNTGEWEPATPGEVAAFEAARLADAS